MNVPLVDLRCQYENLGPDADVVLRTAFANAQYIMGPHVAAFEKEFAAYIGVSHAVSVGNGTDALVIALRALGIGRGDEVITSPYTFFATAEAIAAVGAMPVFVDVRTDTYNIDEVQIEGKITNRTKAILPVHIFGQCANMSVICNIAHSHGLFVIEDACQAAGALYDGRSAGSFGDISCFSFFPTKNLSCAGDGGMICTNQEDLAVVCRALRAHGSGEMGERAYNILHDYHNIVEEKDKNEDNTIYNEKKYYNYLIAQNSRLDEIQAALLRLKLPHLTEYIEKRRKAAVYYTRKLTGIPLILPTEDPKCTHAYHLYVLQSENRETVLRYLKNNGISTGIYYPVPLHLQKCFDDLGYRRGEMPVAEALSRRMFAIPMFPEITDEEQDYVVQNLKEIVGKIS